MLWNSFILTVLLEITTAKSVLLETLVQDTTQYCIICLWMYQWCCRSKISTHQAYYYYDRELTLSGVKRATRRLLLLLLPLLHARLRHLAFSPTRASFSFFPSPYDLSNFSTWMVVKNRATYSRSQTLLKAYFCFLTRRRAATNKDSSYRGITTPSVEVDKASSDSTIFRGAYRDRLWMDSIPHEEKARQNPG